MVGFEFDQAKSDTNLTKHGIDFVEAQKLWDDLSLIEVEAHSEEEKRFLVIGQINEKKWSAVITYRNDNIRIISVRRSRKLEVELYEN